MCFYQDTSMVFRKGYSTQQSLLAILEKWRRSAADNEKTFGALLTNLSKAFD